ncbi:MAG TPA: CPBP family intramembrane glutamic endopeptidase, partial [Longimicrobiales bacterium]|jgi:membrane protease YdiL (CAAX protease family)|nr:CPBP family intramembrane glutamic endopeptidase [Longimicrobiales bacterium]
LCLAVGAIFGFFHVSLFRIVPTAFLGAVLAGVVVLTGSIFPAMLWHGLNNAIALVPSHLGWVDADATIPVLWYPLAIVGLVCSFWILRMARRPYPGLRGERRPRPRGEGAPRSDR